MILVAAQDLQDRWVGGWFIFEFFLILLIFLFRQILCKTENKKQHLCAKSSHLAYAVKGRRRHAVERKQKNRHFQPSVVTAASFEVGQRKQEMGGSLYFPCLSTSFLSSQQPRCCLESGRHAPVAPLQRLRCVPTVTSCHPHTHTCANTHIQAASACQQHIVLVSIVSILPTVEDTNRLMALTSEVGSIHFLGLSGPPWGRAKCAYESVRSICRFICSPPALAHGIKMLLAWHKSTGSTEALSPSLSWHLSLLYFSKINPLKMGRGWCLVRKEGDDKSNNMVQQAALLGRKVSVARLNRWRPVTVCLKVPLRHYWFASKAHPQ